MFFFCTVIKQLEILVASFWLNRIQKNLTTPLDRWCVAYAGSLKRPWLIKAVLVYWPYLLFGLSFSHSSHFSVVLFYGFPFLPPTNVGLPFFYDGVVIVMMMIYALIRFPLIYSSSRGSHKSGQIWRQAWLRATHATAKTPRGTCEGLKTHREHEPQIKRYLNVINVQSFSFCIKFNDNDRWSKALCILLFTHKMKRIRNYLLPASICLLAKLSLTFLQWDLWRFKALLKPHRPVRLSRLSASVRRSAHWSQMAERERDRWQKRQKRVR